MDCGLGGRLPPDPYCLYPWGPGAEPLDATGTTSFGMVLREVYLAELTALTKLAPQASRRRPRLIRRRARCST
jgi:hypothetical protein